MYYVKSIAKIRLFYKLTKSFLFFFVKNGRGCRDKCCITTGNKTGTALDSRSNVMTCNKAIHRNDENIVLLRAEGKLCKLKGE